MVAALLRDAYVWCLCASTRKGVDVTEYVSELYSICKETCPHASYGYSEVYEGYQRAVRTDPSFDIADSYLESGCASCLS